MTRTEKTVPLCRRRHRFSSGSLSPEKPSQRACFTEEKPMASAEDHMRRCIELARMAQQNGDTPVGSLIVRAGQVIAEGIESVKTRMDVSAHAEIEAIRKACSTLKSLDLRGCVLYTTAESCWMCSYAIRQTNIGTVVMGASVPSVGGVTSRHPILADPAASLNSKPPRVVASSLRAQCESLRQKRKPSEARRDR